MEEYRNYFNTLVDISRIEAITSLELRAKSLELDELNPQLSTLSYQLLKVAPPTRRRVTPLTPPASSPLVGPEHFPDIIVEDGCIVLCTECDSSSLGRSSDGYVCRSCGHMWSTI